MTQKQIAELRRAIRAKAGYRVGDVYAYVIPTDLPADADVPDELAGGEPLKYVKLAPGCRLDCYVYLPNDDSPDSGSLSENLEVRYDDGLQVVAVLTTLETIHETQS